MRRFFFPEGSRKSVARILRLNARNKSRSPARGAQDAVLHERLASGGYPSLEIRHGVSFHQGFSFPFQGRRTSSMRGFIRVPPTVVGVAGFGVFRVFRVFRRWRTIRHAIRGGGVLRRTIGSFPSTQRFELRQGFGLTPRVHPERSRRGGTSERPRESRFRDDGHRRVVRRCARHPVTFFSDLSRLSLSLSLTGTFQIAGPRPRALATRTLAVLCTDSRQPRRQPADLAVCACRSAVAMELRVDIHDASVLGSLDEYNTNTTTTAYSEHTTRRPVAIER